MKKWLWALATAALMLSGCGGGGTEQRDETGAGAKEKTFRWKMITTWPKNYPGLGTSAEQFATLLDEMSSGRLKIKVYGAGDLVPAMEVFDAVSQGTAEMGHGAAYYWKGKLPSATFFTAVPFGLNAQEMNSWFYYGGGLELWREAYAPFNLVPFPAGNTGVQMAGWFNREINSIDDLRGLKMRVPGIGGEVLARAGVQPITIPGGELYTAMQTNVIDAVEWVSPYNDLAFGFHQVGKYYYYPGWQEPGAALELIINKKAYEALPDDLKLMVEVAARSVNQDLLDLYTLRNTEALVELVEKHGVDVRPLPDDVLKRLKELTAEVLTELAASDPIAARAYESQKAFLKGVGRYHEISEEAIYNARKP